MLLALVLPVMSNHFHSLTLVPLYMIIYLSTVSSNANRDRSITSPVKKWPPFPPDRFGRIIISPVANGMISQFCTTIIGMISLSIYMHIYVTKHLMRFVCSSI